MADAIEVAAHIFGIDPDDDDIDETVEDALYERWGIDADTFANIAAALLKLTPVLQSPLSEKRAHVFGWQDGVAFVALMKLEANA